MAGPTWEAAGLVGIALVTLETLTASAVAAHNAVRVDRAVAGVNTVLCPTGESLGTVRVCDALRLPTGDVRVPEVAGRAVAARPVVAGLAQRPHPALGQAAGVATLALHAAVRQRALQVGVTAGWTETRAESYRRPGKTGRAEVNNIV